MTRKKKLLSVSQFAAAYEKRGDHYRTPRQIRRLAANGQVEGAQKVGASWVIPEDALVLNMHQGAKPIDHREDPERAMREVFALTRHVLGNRANTTWGD